jgi:hypothetical protein
MTTSAFVPNPYANLHHARNQPRSKRSRSRSRSGLTPELLILSSSSTSVFDEWQDFQRSQTNLDLIDALVEPNESLQQLHLVGKAVLPTSKGQTTPCVVLSADAPDDNEFADSQQQRSTPTKCLLIPINKPQLKLLSFVMQNKPLSKSVLLTLNPLLVNRDGSIFDNIPWSAWTVDPQQRSYDAAKNPVASRYHLGKRDAFARFGGKDWKGRSVSIGNVALRLKYTMVQSRKQSTSEDNTVANKDIALAKRIVELQLQEIREEMAEVDYELAICQRNYPNEVAIWQEKKCKCQERLEVAEQTLQEINNPSPTNTLLGSILDRIADSTTQQGLNAAPYRGAMGYAPMLDTEDEIEEGIQPFTSPFGLMKEILGDQCKAKVIGALLENTSLLDGTLAVGGAIILQRITAQKKMTIQGEELSVNDDTVDYGSGVQGGETILIECDVDEAIGMALACQAPLQVESEIWDRAGLSATPLARFDSDNVMDALDEWEAAQDLSFLMEGQAQNESVSEAPSPLRIPRTTTSLYDSLFEDSNDGPMFPTDNPIQSLSEYDALSQSDKARMLMTLSNFAGKLPRPRVLRTNSRDNKNSNGVSPGPLDDLLLPLIDESVRRQYLVRDAEIRQDYDAIRDLEAQKSRRQAAKEMAEEARYVGDENTAEEWESEAEFYASLRADVTQDEGSYSRFMDRDEWYERDRQKQAKKIDKKKFGTLLDGIE